MGQRKSLLLAPFPADILVWELLLRTLLSPTEGAEGEEGPTSAPRPVLRRDIPVKKKPCYIKRRSIKPNVDDKI